MATIATMMAKNSYLIDPSVISERQNNTEE
jgi:hypothetical protein